MKNWVIQNIEIKNRAWLIWVLLALFIGIAIRLWLYFLDDSFWRDETKLLLNIANRSYLSLMKPLDYKQELSIPLLWLFKSLYIFGARGEFYVRAVSLIANVLALCLFCLIAYRIFTEGRYIFITTLLFALSPGIILFASSVKQYSVDIFIASVLLYLAAQRLYNGNYIKYDYKLYLIAAFSPWLSYPSIFINLAIGVALFLKKFRKDMRTPITYLSVTCISFLLEWLIFLRRSAMVKDWQHFMKLTSLGGAADILLNIFWAYTGLNLTLFLLCGVAVLACLSLLGIIEAWRQGVYAWLVVLVLPILLALGAHVMEYYPLYGRTLLFATPGVYLLAGYGIAFLFRKSQQIKFGTYAMVILIFILILPCLTETIASYTKPMSGVREALHFIEDHQQPGDLVFCDSYASPTILYYRLIGRPYAVNLNYGMKIENQIENNFNISEFNNFCDSIPANGRLWLVAETMGYQREKESSAYLRENIRSLIRRARNLPPPDRHDWILSYWDEFIQNLKANHHLVTQYVNDRVEVYAFDCK